MASFAKITRPRLSGTVKRDRLFRLLDHGRQKPVIWVTAQGGSGKTTLIADWLDSRKLPCLWYQVDEGDVDLASFFYYMGLAAKDAAPRYKQPLPLLTPEYLQGISVFTRRYFEELFSRLKSPSVVVLDNYQDAPSTSGFHDVIAHGLDTIPEGITVVILSRAVPPAPLARLQANSRLHLIGWDDVRFTREESFGLLEMQGHGKLSVESLELLHGKTEGWAAGLILLAGSGAAESESFAGMAAGKLFDYFASEIFSKMDISVQDVLLKTSFLQKIFPALAEELTGNAMAGQLLERMSHNHYFTQKYGEAYRYHPLFREFLQNRARTTLSFTEVAAIQREAAEILERAGDEEEAAGLYVAASDWSGAERVALMRAQALMSQGRGHTLDAWLTSLPGDCLENSPWSLYWLGVCRMAHHQAEARAYLERAFLQFKNRADAAGLFLSWACIVDSIVFEWSDFRPLDHWITVAYGLIAEYPVFPSVEIEARVTGAMLGVMTWRQCHHPDLPLWEERASKIVLCHPSAELRMTLLNHLFHCYIWRGEIEKAGLMLDALRPISDSKEITPLTHLGWFAMETIYFWSVADHARCMRAVTRGLEYANECGIHLLDLYILAHGVYSGVTTGDLVAAQECLAKMAALNSPRIIDKSFYHYQAASVAWSRGDFKKAIEHGELALRFQLIETTVSTLPHGTTLVELALSYFEDGQHEKAKELFAKGRKIARGMKFLAFTCLMCEAKCAFDMGDEDQGLALLRQGLMLGTRQGYVNMHRWSNQTMSRLCAKALEYDIEPEYVKKLIRTRGLVPEGAVANWPYPIRIHTLGRFELLRDDKPVTFTGKVQKKPIELLKALIALGGKDVPEAQLIDALWPDSEGDAAHSTLKTTILRLRQLLGSDEAVLFSGGAVTLDLRFCYVDAYAFDQLMQGMEMPQTAQDAGAVGASKVTDLYKGRFLPADSASMWCHPFRERLRSKFLRFILKRGKALEELGREEDAVALYHRALDADDQQEELYQRLMSSHLLCGQQAEAIAAYRRCKKAMAMATAMPLADLTEALHRTALGG